LINYRPVG